MQGRSECTPFASQLCCKLHQAKAASAQPAAKIKQDHGVGAGNRSTSEQHAHTQNSKQQKKTDKATIRSQVLAAMVAAVAHVGPSASHC
jgi:hypothetical protein